MDCLAGLLEFASYLRGPFTVDKIATDHFLLFRKSYGWMFQGCLRHIFQFAVSTTLIVIEIDRREEPSVNHAHTWYTTFFHKMHKMPVTQVKLFRCFMCGQHSIEVLQIMV